MSNFRQLTTEQLLHELDRYQYKELHIHHTFRPDKSDFTGLNHQAVQTGMKTYHVTVNDWSDIGQHVTLFPDGVWLAGRPFNLDPASIKGWNHGAFAVEMLGNFDIGEEELEGKQRAGSLRIIRYFLDRFGAGSVKFHRDGPGVTKSCPGSGINKADLIREAQALGKSYNDVEANRWSARDIEKAKKLGLIKSAENFRPGEPMTREEAIVVAVRLYELIMGKDV